MEPYPADPVIEKLIYTAPGGTSRVFKANWQGFEVALKELPYDEKTWNEIQLQSQLFELDSVCKCYNYRRMEDTGKIQVIMEWVDHDLYAEIQDRKYRSNPWSEEELWPIFRCLIDTFAYAQQIHICHRDIKPQNILMSGDGKVKIADFGCAKQIFNVNASTMLGSPYFFSPEIKLAFRAAMHNLPHALDYNPFKSDVYSLGLTFLMMVRLQESTELLDLDNLEVITYKLLNEVPSENVKQLLWQMLQINPETRLDFSQLKTFLEGPAASDIASWVEMANSAEENVIMNGLNALLSSGLSLQISVSMDCRCLVCQNMFIYYPNTGANYYYCSQFCYNTAMQADSSRANAIPGLPDVWINRTSDVLASANAIPKEEEKTNAEAVSRCAPMKVNAKRKPESINKKFVSSISKKGICDFCSKQPTFTQCVKQYQVKDKDQLSKDTHNICQECIQQLFALSQEPAVKCPRCSKFFPIRKIKDALKHI